jgi:hypothetical protein
MANKNIEQFIATYGPVAVQVANEINVDPNVLLSQWGMESRWGQSVPASFNVGGIKDFSGTGEKGKDNKTGSVDKYVKFEDPEVFGMYYADMIKRNFPKAVGTGDDVGAFSRGLSEGKRGSYFEIPATEYEQAITNAKTALPSNLPFSPKEQGADGDMVPGAAPPPKPPAPDTSGASRAEQFLFGGIGAGTGAVVSAGQGISNARTGIAATRAGAEETARIAAQRTAGVPAVPGAAPSALSAAPAAPAAPAGAPGASARLPIPSGGPDAGRMAPGQTGTMPYNYGKAAGLTDIEAGRALDMTKQEGGVHDLSSQRREGLNKVKQLFPGESYVENPRFGGIMTPEPSVGAGPRAYTPPSIQAQAAQSSGALPIKGPSVPQIGAAKPPPIPTVPPMPKGPSGLDAVTNMFKGMMRPLKPVVNAARIAGRYGFPPLAGIAAGLEAADVAHEFDKQPEQRDYTKMGLQGATAVGGVMSMFPPTMPLGIPLATGAGLTQAYREDPEMIKRMIERLTRKTGDIPLLDEMTGPLP